MQGESNRFNGLNNLRNRYSADQTQIVGVKFPNSDRVYSYVGGGGIRIGQNIKEAPVTHPTSGKNYTTPAATVVETHGVVGFNVGDKKGISDGKVRSIPTGLKYLPGEKEIKRNPEIQVEEGKREHLLSYLKRFRGGSANETA